MKTSSPGFRKLARTAIACCAIALTAAAHAQAAPPPDATANKAWQDQDRKIKCARLLEAFRVISNMQAPPSTSNSLTIIRHSELARLQTWAWAIQCPVDDFIDIEIDRAKKISEMASQAEMNSGSPRR